MKATLTLLALAVTLLGGLAPTAHAGLILQPAAASTNMGTFPGSSPDNTRNQSGLSTGYTSLVTDFDTYIASNPTHNSNLFANVWVSAIGTLTGNFDFDLGGTFTIQSFALWNFGNNFNNNVRGITRPAFKVNTFSATLGGRVPKTNLFFFASYEGLIHHRRIDYLKNVPTGAERSGDFSGTRVSVSGVGMPLLLFDPFSAVETDKNVYTHHPFRTR